MDEVKLKFSTLKDYSHLRQECILLIERAFEYAIEQKFDIDFLPLMSEQNAENNHIIVDENTGKIIAHIGVVLRELGNTKFKTPCALVGGIAVEEEYRGKGLFKTLMNHIIDHYNDKVALFILWSDKNEMYESFDFIQAGGIVESSSDSDLSSELLSSYSKVNYRDLPSKQKNEIQNIYESVTSKNYTTFLRSSESWNIIEEMTSTDLYIKTEDDKVLSYFFMNKGFDLQGIIHEFGYVDGTKEDVINELKTARLWLSESDLSLCPMNHLIFAALFRPANQKLFSDFIHNWSAGDLEVIKINEDEVEFTFHGNSYNEPYQNFLPGLFGPSPIEEFENYGPALYLSGLDSI